MCQKCDELTVILVEDTLRGQLMAAQRSVGLLPAIAVRPLFTHEQYSQAWFTELEDDLDRGINEAAHAVEQAHEDLAALIAARLTLGSQTTVNAEQLISRLKLLQEKLPRDAQIIIDKAVKNLELALSRAYQYAALRVIQERARQTGDDDDYVLPTIGKRASVLAGPAVQRSWTWLVQKTQEHIASPGVLMQGSVSVDSIQQAVRSIGAAGAVDQAKQAVNSATGLGRVETAMDHDVEDVYASELLDGSTCRACAAVDGTKYEDLDTATQDYPVGYYQRCSGGARCRGSLLFLFSGQSTRNPSIVPAPSSPPALDPATFPKPTANVSAKMMEHIAGREKRGKGGHVFGYVYQGKTVFPAHWDMNKIVQASDRVIAHGAVVQRNAQILYRRLSVDGVHIEVLGQIKKDGTVSYKSAYPLYGPGVYGSINGQYFPISTANDRAEFIAELSNAKGKIES